MIVKRFQAIGAFFILVVAALCLAGCQGGDQFVGWQTEEFGAVGVTESVTKEFILGNQESDQEQHLRGLAFDRGSNAAGHFRLDGIRVGDRPVEGSDIIVPPGSALTVTVTYAPTNLEPSAANYGGWATGEEERWIPKHPDEVGEEEEGAIYQRAIVLGVYDHPKEGIFYVQLVGEAVPGPDGEEESGAGSATCTPGGGVACYTGGFAIDIPQLAPGGPKPLEITGPVRMGISGGAATMVMDDFPYVIFHLRSEEIPQLPSGVSATLVLSGVPGVEASGTFDGARLTLEGVAFRVRVALGDLSAEQIQQGMSALVDFELTDLTITTTSPLTDGEITLHMETTIPNNPSGNELFDQFLSGAQVVAYMEGELAL